MGDRRGDNFLLFPLVQGVELAVGPKHEQSVDALLNELVQKPSQARQVQIFVGLHGRCHLWDNATNVHDALNFLTEVDGAAPDSGALRESLPGNDRNSSPRVRLPGELTIFQDPLWASYSDHCPARTRE